jgi:nitrate/TMAO reductase-like tetraheme cytochrome c subunit
VLDKIVTPDASAQPERQVTGDPSRVWWSRWWKRIASVVVVLVVLFVGGSALAAKSTESNKFCGTDCHEMWPYRDTWAVSTHKSFDCVTCHIPPGPVDFLKTKFFASREVWVHFTGLSAKPITVTRHIPNGACDRSGCHTASQTNKTISLGTPAPTTFQHGSPGHTKQLCVACHAALVHGGAPGVTAAPANSMPSCFTCHPVGKTDCSYCHKAPHADRGPCQNCHSLGAWTGGKNFAHPQPLVGKHAQISCQTCHTQGTAVKPDGCINCHGDQHNGLKNCDSCHSLAAWIPSTYQHPQEGPHVPNGDEKLPCNVCHLNGFGQPASCPCHGGSAPTGGG